MNTDSLSVNGEVKTLRQPKLLIYSRGLEELSDDLEKCSADDDEKKEIIIREWNELQSHVDTFTKAIKELVDCKMDNSCP